MFVQTYFSLSLIFSSFFLGNGEKDSSEICVLGGGISGIVLTKLLQDKGHDVSLFESESRWGGKISTYRSLDKRVVMEKGAIVFSPDFYYINQYIDKYNISKIPYDILDVSPLINPATAGLVKYAMKQKQKDKMAQSFQILDDFFKKIPLSYFSPGYASLPPESPMGLPYGEVLKLNGVTELNPIAAIAGITTGYGHLDVTPAIYFERGMRANDTVKMVRKKVKWFTPRDGFDTLIDKMAEEVNRKFLGHKAVNIQRTEKGQIVTFHLFGGKVTRTHSCCKTVLAFPPTLKNIGIISDLSPEEIEIFKQVKVIKYASHGHIIPTFVYRHYYGFSPIAIATEGREILPQLKYPEGNGDIVMFVKALGSKHPFAYSSYSWIKGDFDEEASLEEVQMMTEKATNLCKKIHPFSRLLWSENWEYFPHVSSESIRNGFYQKLDKIQGRKGVYYASTLLTFELLDAALEMVNHMANKYF